MRKRSIAFVLFICLCFINLHAQKQSDTDTVALVDYDELFNELDDFIDSLYAPQAMFLINIGMGTNYFIEKSSAAISHRKLVFTPSVGYYFKNGFGISSGASVVPKKKLDAYQFTVSGSYDYLKSFNFITGLSFTRFFTKDSLPFYTPPLVNEFYGYYTYKKLWVKPTVSLRYGWGSRQEYEERKDLIRKLKRLSLNNVGSTTTISTNETINDFVVAASLRHDFYWLDVLQKIDFIRLTPQLSFTSGTQKFGFNQTSNSYITKGAKGLNILYNSENIYLEDEQRFQPLSLSLFLKSEIAVGKFSVEPQLMFDYYLPGNNKNISTLFGLSAGLIF